MARTPEGKVKDQVRTLLRHYNVWYFMPVSSGMGRHGIPDFVCIVAGRFVGIECKADPTKLPTPLQLKCMGEIQAAGGLWFLVDDEQSLRTVEVALKMLV